MRDTGVAAQYTRTEPRLEPALQGLGAPPGDGEHAVSPEGQTTADLNERIGAEWLINNGGCITQCADTNNNAQLKVCEQAAVFQFMLPACLRGIWSMHPAKHIRPVFQLLYPFSVEFCMRFA